MFMGELTRAAVVFFFISCIAFFLEVAQQTRVFAYLSHSHKGQTGEDEESLQTSSCVNLKNVQTAIFVFSKPYI